MKGSIPKVAWLLRFLIELRGAVASSNLRSVSARCVPVPPKQPHSALPRQAPDPSLSPTFLFLSAPSLLFPRRTTEQRKPLYTLLEKSRVRSRVRIGDAAPAVVTATQGLRHSASPTCSLTTRTTSSLFPAGWASGSPCASGARVASGDSGSASAGGRAWGWRRRV